LAEIIAQHFGTTEYAWWDGDTFSPPSRVHDDLASLHLPFDGEPPWAISSIVCSRTTS
jgi:hypothetical protein